MSPTPPSATSSHGQESPDAFRVVRKRNRIPLSCAPCRHRKLKCNRQSPCDNCIKRGDSTACAYAAPAQRKKGQNAANASPDDMQNRIDRLEGLVLSLMNNGASAGATAAAQQALSSHSNSIGSESIVNDDTMDENVLMNEPAMMDAASDHGAYDSETEGVTKSMGILKVDSERQKTVYIGESHWAALLNEIGEVKSYFSQHKKEYEAQMHKIEAARKAQGGLDAGSGPALLFGAGIPPSRKEILGQLPSRYTCDVLVARYFNTFDPSAHILHGPAFQKQYNSYWEDPSKTSIVWVALLFGLLRLAVISYGREGDEPPELTGKCHDLAVNYRAQLAHCLIMADYTKPHNFVIETLIFHLHAEHVSNRDAEASVWVLNGMIVRLAMRMGYHRDSKNFPNMSPFQAEMRRRVWTFVRTSDLLFSFQLALPSMIRIGDSDTELPRNIHDDEFDEDSKELPAARPPNEATQVSYLIAKGKLAFGFGRVLEEINGVERHGYEEVLKIDKGLQEIYAGIPEHLKLRPMSEQQLAPMTLIIARFGMATVYHKSQCVLHRRFVRLARSGNKYCYSRRTCIDSAMQLLSFQAIQHQHSQERGRMRNLRHYFNSLITHDFLLAATIVCMDLYNHRERPESDISTPNTSVSGSASQHSSNVSADGTYIPGSNYTRDDLIKALEQSRDIWYQNRDLSMEAYKASELLNVLIYHIRLPFSPSQTNSQLPIGVRNSANGSNRNTGMEASGSADDEQTAAMTLGMLQAGGMTPNSASTTAQLAQQGLGWNTSKLNPTMNAFLSGQQGSNNPGVDGNTNTSPFGSGVMNMMNSNTTFPDALFGHAGGFDMSMNIDWDSWDQYLQPSNLSLDPAANLWGPSSPNATANANPLFASNQSQPTPPRDVGSTGRRNTSNTGAADGFGFNGGAFFSQADLPKSDMPNLSSEAGIFANPSTNGDSAAANRNNSVNSSSASPLNGNTSMPGDNGDGNEPVSGGDAFMGAGTPGPNLGLWRWTGASGKS